MRSRTIHVALATALLVALTACGRDAPVRALTTSARIPSLTFDRNSFTRSTTIDNRWFPLIPGTEFVYVGRVNAESERVGHRVVFVVTDLTKMVDGVRTVVLYDRDYDESQLAEAELAFDAQDDAGNVWSVGEYPEEYKDGKLTGAPATRIPGQARASAGSLMLANPSVGTPSYAQGLAPAIDFADRAQVWKTEQRDCVPAGCYEHVLLTEEWDSVHPAAHQLKYFASGVGTIRVGFRGNDTEQEGLTLSRVVHLSPAEMDSIRARVLAQDARAYKVSTLYGSTARALMSGRG